MSKDNEQLSLADLGNHNEYIMEHRDLKFCISHDVARILNPKKMPKPTGKVYKG